MKSHTPFLACGGAALPLIDPIRSTRKIERLQQQADDCHALGMGALGRALENQAADLLDELESAEAMGEYVPRVGIYKGGAG